MEWIMTLLFLVLAASSVSPVPVFTVTPEGIAGITAESTIEDLAAIFGQENLQETREHMGEGFYSDGTLVNGGTEGEFAVVWERGLISEIRITGTASTVEGIALGATLTDLEEVIGPFEMAGFAWDYEGYVQLDGTIHEGLYMRLTTEEEIPEHLIGDRLFRSEELRELNLVLTDFRIIF